LDYSGRMGFIKVTSYIQSTTPEIQVWSKLNWTWIILE
jgi:hypothetical protein